MKTGVVDVGGGLRGVYAAGVFDPCPDAGIRFDVGGSPPGAPTSPPTPFPFRAASMRRRGPPTMTGPRDGEKIDIFLAGNGVK